MANNPQELSASKQALLKIRELKQQLADAQAYTGEPIAIVSMACRFPRTAKTPERFWQSLVDQSDEVSEIPDDRWDLDAFHDDDPEVPGKMYARKGVFLDDIDKMDPEFFGISPREATWVDPQQRLLLEVGWEALERAGWTPERIGEETGVFVGWMHNDYQNEASDSFLNLNPYIATGAAGSFLCGRLAYYLGLQGPSVAVDTACSSSLVALHLAIQSLQRRDCDRALVGGVNAICSPTTNILTCKLQALSPSGHSRAFDAAADGYLRGEGCGVITLRRLSDAEQDNDPIIGVIRGSAIGHNGFSSGLTAPNPKAQEKVIRQAVERAKIQPHDVAYLEAHGTGTELGDPIEMRAAAAALAQDRDAQNPLLVGSVKTNIGHLEAAAGMAGIIKVLLAMGHDRIPGQMNFETPNPHIPWDTMPVKVLTELTEWPKDKRRIAGVSAFGMSGTNAHVIIESPGDRAPTSAASTNGKSKSQPAALSTNGDSKTQPASQLLVLSGKSDEAVQTLAEDLARQISEDDSINLADIAYTTSVRRSHFERRAAVVAGNRSDAADQLKLLSRGGASDAVYQGGGRRAPKVAWQFTGQGSQYVGMGKQLYQSEPIFRAAIDHCDEVLKQWRSESLIEIMFNGDDQIDQTRWTQPAIFAVQMGLTKLLQSWGMQPDVVLGHSVGQYAAACVAGIMSWDDGLKLISERGRLIGDLPPGGKMLAVFAPLVAIQELINAIDDLSLAALNGTHLVVSGPEETIFAFETALKERNVRTKLLTTSHAFHSALMEPALEPFREFADSVTFETARLPLICNVAGAVLPIEQQLDGEYWARHIREPVQFSASIEAAAEMGCEAILEIGPNAVLTRMASAVWRGAANGLVSSLKKGVAEDVALLHAVGNLYVLGAAPNFAAMHGEETRQSILLPTYPFQRRRFWGPDKPRAFHAEYHTAHPLLGSPIALAGVENQTRYEGFIAPDSPSWIGDHELMGHVVLPGAAYVEMAIAAANAGAVTDLAFEQPLRPTARTAMQTIVQVDAEKNKTIETFSAAADGKTWTRHFSGKLVDEMSPRPEAVDRAKIEAALTESASPADFYAKMHETGLTYGPEFQTIQSIQYSPTEVLCRLETNSDIRGFTIPPTLLDGALHSLAVGLLQESSDHLFLPVGMARVQCFQAIEDTVWCHATWTENEGKIRTANVVLFTESGQVVAQIEGLKVQQVSIAALRQMSGSGVDRLVHELKWETLRLPASNTKNKNWLIVEQASDSQSEANGEATATIKSAVAKQLSDGGHNVVRVTLAANAKFKADSESAFIFDGESLEDWQQLFKSLSNEEAAYAPAGIAWFLDDQAEDAAAKRICTGVMQLVAVLYERNLRKLECGLQLVTTGAISADDEETVDPHQTQYWGLGRVLGAEQPEFRCRLIDLPAAETDQPETLAGLIDVLLTETRDNQLAIRSGQLLSPRMKRIPLEKQIKQRAKLAEEGLFSADWRANPDKCYLITGGLGMLGRQAAKWLAEKGASQVMLVSRRKPDEATQQFLETVAELGCQTVVHSADLGSRSDVAKMFERFGGDLNPLGGLIHAAGVLDDALIEKQTWDRFAKVMAPKVGGATILHEFTKELDLEFFVLYSSAASVLGSPGQSNYATANAFLDGLAWQRRAEGLPAISINWGPWTEGMADDERIIKRLALQGITPLTVAEAHSAMEKMLAAGVVQATVMDVEWRRMRMGMSGETPAILEGLVASRQRSQRGDSALVSKLKKMRGAAQRELLVKTMQELLQGILDTPEPPELDRPLIELGLDSLMAVEFGTELQQMLGDQFAVGPTMLFDHPTIDAIVDFVLELISSDSDTETDSAAAVASDAPADAVRVREDVAIIGMSCRFPGANNVEEFWQNLLDGVDSVGEIPTDRWDIDRFYSEDRSSGKMYTREGGFLEGIGDFDAEFFNISPQEACWIDPQHRMLLENSYRALEDAGIPTAPLADSNVGVFMGIMGQDYAFLPKLDDLEVIKAFQGAGLSHSAGVGRISYVFGFEGPSVAVDTASSSSLVALFQAVRSLQDGNCNMALAGGVNAILAPVNSLLMSKAGLLAPDGRCKSFSSTANGFGRGEGCGIVVLKRLSDAQRDGDRIMAVVRGGAVVHNGFSGGITAPNSKSQARVITEALQDARVAPSQVQYLEAHGTGTEYGDPMEIGAAASVYGKGRNADNPLLVGSVKANISHLEAAGGSSGLIKTVLSLYHGIIPPQIHLEEPSPHVPWNRMPVSLVKETTPWPETEQRLAGLTALGLVGTNAHIVLSGAPAVVVESDSAEPPAEMAASDRAAELLVLSARSEAALDAMVNDYRSFLHDRTDVDFADVCFTAAVGRRHYEHRIAVTGSNREEAIQSLAKLVASHPSTSNGSANGEANGKHVSATSAPGASRGFTKTPPKVVWAFTAKVGESLAAGRELYRSEPQFRNLITEFDARLAEHGAGESPLQLQAWLAGEGDSEPESPETHLYAIQAGLAQLWQSWGVEPDGAFGFGVGQYTAACVAGGLCFKDALILVHEHERMVEKSEAELTAFEALADKFNFYPPNLPLICSISGDIVPVHRSLGGSYWRDHCVAEANVASVMESLASMGGNVILELDPPAASSSPIWQQEAAASLSRIASLRENQHASISLIEALGELYVLGVNPLFSRFFEFCERQKVGAPLYPFQKQRYWITEIADHLEPAEPSPVKAKS